MNLAWRRSGGSSAPGRALVRAWRPCSSPGGRSRPAVRAAVVVADDPRTRTARGGAARRAAGSPSPRSPPPATTFSRCSRLDGPALGRVDAIRAAIAGRAPSRCCAVLPGAPATASCRRALSAGARRHRLRRAARRHARADGAAPSPRGLLAPAAVAAPPGRARAALLPREADHGRSSSSATRTARSPTRSSSPRAPSRRTCPQPSRSSTRARAPRRRPSSSIPRRARLRRAVHPRPRDLGVGRMSLPPTLNRHATNSRR